MTESETPNAPACRHIMIDLSGCDAGALNDANLLENALSEIAARVHTRVEAHLTHRFERQGVNAVAIVGASHISVHTWPESGYAGVDIMAYDSGVSADELAAWLAHKLSATSQTCHELLRGPAQPEAAQR